jgi:hypothetical protein
MEMYRKDFDGFVAKRMVSVGVLGLGRDVEVILWKHPDHGNLSGTFILHDNRVHAFGDFYDKMYRFNRDVSLEYLKNESLGHFTEKCTTRGEEWDEDEAERSIREYVSEFLFENAGDISEARRNELKAIYDSEYSEAAGSAANACNFAHEYDFESESFYKAGVVADHVCVRHLVALKMIAEQLA